MVVVSSPADEGRTTPNGGGLIRLVSHLPEKPCATDKGSQTAQPSTRGGVEATISRDENKPTGTESFAATADNEASFIASLEDGQIQSPAVQRDTRGVGLQDSSASPGTPVMCTIAPGTVAEPMAAARGSLTPKEGFFKNTDLEEITGADTNFLPGSVEGDILGGRWNNLAKDTTDGLPGEANDFLKLACQTF